MRIDASKQTDINAEKLKRFIFPFHTLLNEKHHCKARRTTTVVRKIEMNGGKTNGKEKSIRNYAFSGSIL